MQSPRFAKPVSLQLDFRKTDVTAKARITYFKGKFLEVRRSSSYPSSVYSPNSCRIARGPARQMGRVHDLFCSPGDRASFESFPRIQCSHWSSAWYAPRSSSPNAVVLTSPLPLPPFRQPRYPLRHDLQHSLPSSTRLLRQFPPLSSHPITSHYNLTHPLSLFSSLTAKAPFTRNANSRNRSLLLLPHFHQMGSLGRPDSRRSGCV